MSVSYLMKGALVEYGTGLAAVLPNIVMFQFNPESITRTLEIPPRPSGASLREVNQSGEIPELTRSRRPPPGPAVYTLPLRT